MKPTESQRTTILEVYSQYFQAADRIIENPDLAKQFCEGVNSRLAPVEHFEVRDLNHVLHNLRKLGEAKGGLPRKQRQYKGRQVAQTDSAE